MGSPGSRTARYSFMGTRRLQPRDVTVYFRTKPCRYPSSGVPVAFSVSTAGRGIPHCVFHPGSSGSHRPAHARSRSSSATGRSVSPLCFARPAWSRSLTPWHDPHTRISPGWKVSQ